MSSHNFQVINFIFLFMFRILFYLISVTFLLTMWGCKGFFGEKTDLNFIEAPAKGTLNSEAYIPILPSLIGFIDPVDVIGGFDQLIYIADKGAGKIYSYDQSGKRLSEFFLPGVKSIAQDRRLNLLALATFDTLINETSYSLDAIYRINMSHNGKYSLANGQIINKIIHPFYFKTSLSSADGDIRLNDLAILADNSYYVTRSGNRNSTLQFGGPDNSVLIFNSKDEWKGNVIVRTNEGSFIDFFKNPYSIASEVQPPTGSSTKVSSNKGFIISMLDNNLALKVQGISIQTGEQGDEFVVNSNLASKDTSKADGFLYTANRFRQPMGIGYQYDATDYLFVVDSEKDSLYQFTKSGFEGVNPRPGTSRTKNIKTSFGGRGEGPLQLYRPMAVAFLNRTVYVADAGNKRITRYRLTRDIE